MGDRAVRHRFVDSTEWIGPNRTGFAWIAPWLDDYDGPMSRSPTGCEVDSADRAEDLVAWQDRDRPQLSAE
jgi:hypothetical protein